MTGIDNLISFYNLSEQGSMSKNILFYILQNLKELYHMSIYDLADACFVSPASISRLVKKLGYKNYSYFQKDITDCVEKYEYHNRILPNSIIQESEDIPSIFFGSANLILQNVAETLDMEKLYALVKACHESKRAAIYTFDVSFAERFLQFDFFMSGKNCAVCHLFEDMEEDAQSRTKDDLVIMVMPQQIEGPDAKKIISVLKSTKCKICIMTDSKHSNVLKQADFSIAFEGKMCAIDSFGLQSLLCITAIMYRYLYIDS